MAKKHGLSWEKLSSLADFQSAIRASLDEMIALVKECLHEQPYSKEEVRYVFDSTDWVWCVSDLGPWLL
jgi:hypothetical protein